MHETERPILIQDLDDTHVLVRADALEGLEARLEAEVGWSRQFPTRDVADAVLPYSVGETYLHP